LQVVTADCIDYGSLLHWTGGIQTPYFAWTVVGDSDHVYLGDPQNGLYVVDITDPGSPKIVGHLPMPGQSHDREVAGDYLYCADWVEGMQVINVADPTNPGWVGHLSLPGSCNGLTLRDNYVYLANRDLGLCVVDVSDPSSPTLVESEPSLGSPWKVAVDGTHAFVSEHANGLSICPPEP
jgi:hypothetical protein